MWVSKSKFIISALVKWRWEDHKFEARLFYIVTSCLKQTNKHHTTKISIWVRLREGIIFGIITALYLNDCSSFGMWCLAVYFASLNFSFSIYNLGIKSLSKKNRWDNPCKANRPAHRNFLISMIASDMIFCNRLLKFWLKLAWSFIWFYFIINDKKLEIQMQTLSKLVSFVAWKNDQCPMVSISLSYHLQGISLFPILLKWLQL
jgi:hypothetical protein